MSAEIYLFKFSQIYRTFYLGRAHGRRLNVVDARFLFSLCITDAVSLTFATHS